MCYELGNDRSLRFPFVAGFHAHVVYVAVNAAFRPIASRVWIRPASQTAGDRQHQPAPIPMARAKKSVVAVEAVELLFGPLASRVHFHGMIKLS
jgi:hypothetical protein